MANLFNPDFLDFLKSLNQNNVDYLLVGGYAVILHGYERVTADMDIWVRRTQKNYDKLRRAFQEFGMPMHDMTLENFLYNEQFDVFRFGRKPVAIDLMIKVKGLTFEDAYINSVLKVVDEIPIRLINYQHLLKAKREAGRSKDKDDLENLSPAE